MYPLIDPCKSRFQKDQQNKFDELILILNPNSQGGVTGKNWNDTYAQIKEFLPKQHRIVFTKKADDELISHTKTAKVRIQEYCSRRRRWYN